MMMLQVTNISTFNETELGGTYLVSSISKKRTDRGLRQIMYGKYQTTPHSKWWPDLEFTTLYKQIKFFNFGRRSGTCNL